VQKYNSQKSFGALFVFAAMFLSGTAAAQDTQVIVNTGNPDGRLGALSRRPSANKLETETADFVLKQATVLKRAGITGLTSPATPLANIANVEVEMHRVFPKDSADPPSGNVPSRVFSAADVEIDSATRWCALSINAIFTLGLIGAGLAGTLRSILGGPR
jgi:hypothetical protein